MFTASHRNHDKIHIILFLEEKDLDDDGDEILLVFP